MLNVPKNSPNNGFKTVLVKLNGIYYAFQVEIFFSLFRECNDVSDITFHFSFSQSSVLKSGCRLMDMSI